jgi:hypothetical protein
VCRPLIQQIAVETGAARPLRMPSLSCFSCLSWSNPVQKAVGQALPDTWSVWRSVSSVPPWSNPVPRRCHAAHSRPPIRSVTSNCPALPISLENRPLVDQHQLAHPPRNWKTALLLTNSQTVNTTALAIHRTSFSTRLCYTRRTSFPTRPVAYPPHSVARSKSENSSYRGEPRCVNWKNRPAWTNCRLRLPLSRFRDSLDASASLPGKTSRRRKDVKQTEEDRMVTSPPLSPPINHRSTNSLPLPDGVDARFHQKSTGVTATPRILHTSSTKSPFRYLRL